MNEMSTTINKSPARPGGRAVQEFLKITYKCCNPYVKEEVDNPLNIVSAMAEKEHR